jgi:hypothetical protein
MYFFMTSPHPLFNLTPPSPTGRGEKFGEKIITERGFTEYKNVLPFSCRRRGGG